MENMGRKLLLIATIFMVGCVEQKVIQKQEATTTNKAFVVRGPLNFPSTLNVIVIDGCEYLYGYVGGNEGCILCHKGNCNNSVHIYNKKKLNDLENQ